MRLFLIRHGRTAWNEEGRCQGCTDIPLDEIGLQQAEAMGRAFSEIPIDLILSSDLGRCLQTASFLGKAPREITEALRERSYGDWEGQKFSEIAALVSEREAHCCRYDVCAPGGESIRHAWNRLLPITNRLKTLNGNVAVITHGQSKAILLAQLIGGGLDTTRAFRFENTAITELERRPEGTFRIVRLNDHVHLRAQLAAQ